jgi:hypothetical protein
MRIRLIVPAARDWRDPAFRRQLRSREHQAQTTTAAKPTTAMRVALAAIKGDRTIADWRVNSGSIRSYAERII